MACATTSISSIAIAVEDQPEGFGNISPLTGVPATTGLTFVTAAGISRAELTTFGEAEVDLSDDQVRSRAHGLVGEIATVWDHSTGKRIRRRKGELTLTFNEVQLLGDGTGSIATYPGHPLYMLMHSGMKVQSPSFTDDTVANASTDYAYEGTALTAAYSANIGGLFSTVIGNKVEYSAITATIAGTPDTIHHSPAMSRALTTGDALRMMETFYVSSNLLLDSGSSVALQLDGVGWRTYAYGCRATSISGTVTETGRLSIAITMQCSYVTDDHYAASVVAGTNIGTRSVPNGASQYMSNAYFVLGTDPVPADGTAPPFEIPRTAAAAMKSTISWTVTNSFVGDGLSSNIMGISELCLTNSSIEVNGTLTAPTHLGLGLIDDDLLDREYRSLLIGYSPTFEGMGLAVYIPAAHLTFDGSKRDTSGEQVKFSGIWGDGPWQGDTTLTTAGGAAFRIGFGK